MLRIFEFLTFLKWYYIVLGVVLIAIFVYIIVHWNEFN